MCPCPLDILITWFTSCWLFTALCSTWPGNHLVRCVAELVRSCFPIHAYWGLPDPKCAAFIYLVYRCTSLSITFALSRSMTWFSSTTWSVIGDLWVTLLSFAQEAWVCLSAVKESTSFLCSLILRTNFLLVSPIYELKQFLQWTLQINSVFSSLILYFGHPSMGNYTQLCRVRSFCIINFIPTELIYSTL